MYVYIYTYVSLVSFFFIPTWPVKRLALHQFKIKSIAWEVLTCQKLATTSTPIT